MTHIWTSREVHFECIPRITDEAFDAFFDSLPEHYWETWRHRAFGTLFISSTGQVVHVGGWPWWVPEWCARRSVAAVAGKAGAGGDARFVVERTVLV